METKNNLSESENHNSLEPSFQVMPREGQIDTPAPAQPLEDAGLPRPPRHFGSKKLWAILAAVVILAALAAGAYFYFFASSQNDEPIAVTKLPKVWLLEYFQTETCGDLTVCGDEADGDNDGLTNYDEFRSGTSPINPDTDNDGLADGDEINIYKTDPVLDFTYSSDTLALENDWYDGFQVFHEYDPLTPRFVFTQERRQQITEDIARFGLHEPTITLLNSDEATLEPQVPKSMMEEDSMDQEQSMSPSHEPTTISVTIQNYQFNQASVTLQKGDTVVWTNLDPVQHTVTGVNGGPKSQYLNLQDTYSFTFTEAGTFEYSCIPHPQMKGTVIVN